MIRNKYLLKWLGEYIDPKEWVVELTGGEPGLYPEIDTLIPALNEMGYYGVIKTNGSLPVPKSKNFQLITAWHKGEPCPAQFDQILIIRNQDDNWDDKVNFCKENNMPCQTIEFDEINDDRFNRETKFKAWTYINSLGQITECPKGRINEYKHIFNMSPPELLYTESGCGSRCKIIGDTEKFLPEEIKGLL